MCIYFICVVLADMTLMNSEKVKHAKTKTWADTSHTAVSAKADDALCRSEKDNTESRQNFLPVFRIPRIPKREDIRTSSAAVDSRCERKTVNFSPMLKTDSQKHFSSNKANVSADHATDIRSHCSSVHKRARTGWSDAAAKPHMLRSSSEMRNYLTGAVHSRSVKAHSDCRTSVAAHASKHQLHQSTAVNHDKVTVAQSDPQEPKPTLPEELSRAGWKLCWSKQRNRWYIFNVRTGTSSWDVPK